MSIEKARAIANANKRARIAATPFEDFGIVGKRSRILLEQNYCCAECGIKDWNNKPLTLELDHKDGDKTNETRENLWCLCPNCHSQTPTFRGRNIKQYSDGRIRK